MNKLELAIDRFFDAANAKFGSDYHTLEAYSGRGMFGRTSPAAITTGYHPESEIGRSFKETSGAYVDNLGRDYVYYLK